MEIINKKYDMKKIFDKINNKNKIIYYEFIQNFYENKY